MPRTAVQLYTLRDVNESLPALIDRVAAAGFGGVEFATRFPGADTDAVAAALDRTGLAAVGAHVGVDRLEADLEGTLAAYRRVGCEAFVVPWLGPEAFADADAVAATAERLTTLAAAVADGGRSLHYHNHDHELAALGDRTAFEELAARSGDALGLELDVGWVRAGGADPVDFLGRYGDRVDLLHVTDVDADGTPVGLGDGVVDLRACLRVADEQGVGTLVYEHDDPADPIASLADAAAFLS